MVELPSKTQIRKAGLILRGFEESGRFHLSLSPEEVEKLERASDIVEAYRASFSYPLLKVRLGLESFVKTRGYAGARIAQRLKRQRRIITKLARHHGMQITTMQDIGGCRVVLPHLEAVYELNDHIDGQWGEMVTNFYDYIEDPPDSGYRALHVVVEREERLIEIQLRTERQHRWADFVEELGRDMGHELKSGEGPSPVLKFFALLADAIALRDRDELVPQALVEGLESAFEGAEPYIADID